MSGVMIKTGVYGVMRVVSCFDSHLFAIGLIVLCSHRCGNRLVGVILAALQREEIARLFEHRKYRDHLYRSRYRARQGGRKRPIFTQVWPERCCTLNHSFFKSLPFCGAGNIYTATHTTSLDDFGRIGQTDARDGDPVSGRDAGDLRVAAASGFVSEFLIYMGLLDGIAANGR